MSTRRKDGCCNRRRDELSSRVWWFGVTVPGRQLGSEERQVSRSEERFGGAKRVPWSGQRVEDGAGGLVEFGGSVGDVGAGFAYGA